MNELGRLQRTCRLTSRRIMIQALWTFVICFSLGGICTWLPADWLRTFSASALMVVAVASFWIFRTTAVRLRRAMKDSFETGGNVAPASAG